MTPAPSLAIDVDGVLADYLAGVKALALPESTLPYTQIREDPDFWRRLPPYPQTRDTLQTLTAHVQRGRLEAVYFFTRRYGIQPQQQTKDWLVDHGYLAGPAVLIVEADRRKGELAWLLRVTDVIDDRMTVGRFVRRSRFYLLDRPWNQDDTPLRGQVRVRSVQEALDRILTVPAASTAPGSPG